MQYLVSIVIPVYNKEKYIKRCLDSILAQNYENLEILLIDDGSTDKSLEVINSYDDNRLKVLKFKTNQGVSKARNLGIRKSKGRFLAFLDADDYYGPEKIKKQVEYMIQNNYAFTYTDFYYHDIKHKRVIVPEKLNYKEAVKNTIVNVDTVMFDMKKINKQALYMPSLIRGEDIYMGWNALKQIEYVYRVPTIYSVYCIKASSTSKYAFKSMIKSYNLYKTLPVKTYIKWYYYLCFIKNAFLKRRCAFEKNKD